MLLLLTLLAGSKETLVAKITRKKRGESESKSLSLLL